ncbi:MAG: glycine C-acetyltransferase [Coriobacteriia bacterium]|nr:glycine C-acetyltransferase [Coriobacteriia bacterium]MBN2822823.1 glycine C-acetyltransferase [Coriobacteriia bacterium]
MFGSMKDELRSQISALHDASLYKSERVIVSPQRSTILVATPDANEPREVVNFCANNYLGLADDIRVVEAAHAALDRWGFGTSSVRFICGTFEVHKELEARLSEFLGCEDTILYSSAFDANGGFFEPFFGPDDAIIADALNHASVIDGVRLTKARRFIYKHSDMDDLRAKLIEAQSARYRVIATDGVFSMDGDIALLEQICDLAEEFDAVVMVDDSHATGFVGPTGRGTPELCGVTERVDVITTTFGKALGGASGGCLSGRAEIVEWLRQKSRPYLFSNTVAPVVAASTIAVLDLLSETTELRDRLESSALSFRKRMTGAGFDITPGTHPIVPVMLRDEAVAHRMADALLDEGIYVIGFSYPVVPKGAARIRVQISAAHTDEQLDLAVSAFERVGRRLGVIE